NQPYRFSFEVEQSTFVINVSSSGPDKKFKADQRYYGDDFVIWTSPIDYFAETRTRINDLLSEQLKQLGRFPQNEPELSEVLRNSVQPLESLRDPWGHSYYATFTIQPFYSDRFQIENRTKLGNGPAQHVKITPVTSRAATIHLRSMGQDGKIGTPDDFDVATFVGVLTEQSGSEPKPQVITSPVVFSGFGGAITGKITDPNGSAIANATITATRSPDSQSYATSS